jgi:hypothetical protein
MSWDVWEGVAAAHVEAANLGSPVDPWLAAWALEIRVETGLPGAKAVLDGDVIRVDPTARFEKQCFDVAHEVAHVLLEEAGLEDTEPACNAVASCLILPRIDYRRMNLQTNGCLLAMRERQPYASCEVIARRKLSVEPGVAWIWDLAPKWKRYPLITHGHRWPHRHPTEAELDVMQRAASERVPVEDHGGIRAWPVIDGAAVRVISIAPFDVLEAFATPARRIVRNAYECT